MKKIFFSNRKNQPENKNNKFKFDYNLNSFHLMRLVARNYSKNYGAIFIDFILPTIIISISFNILSVEALRTMLPGFLISPLISSGFISFSMAVLQWRKSIIFKKIKISQISTVQFFFAFFLFYFLISFLSFSSLLGFAIILKYLGTPGLKYILDDLAQVNWIWAIQAIIYTILIAISMGVLMSFLTTNINSILAIGLTLFLVQAFLFGCYLSLNLVIPNEGIYKTSWFFPFYAPVRMFQLAWLENIEYNFQFKGEIQFLIDKNGQIVILQEYDGIDANEIIQYLRSPLTSSAKIEEILAAKEWEIVKKINPIYNISIVKNFKIIDENSLWNNLNSPKYNEANFHNSYWSLILLGLGWFVIINSGNFFVSKYKKK